MVVGKEDDSTRPGAGADDSAPPAALTLMHIAKGWTPEEVEADIASEGLDFDDVIAEERAYIEKLKRIHESKDAPSPPSADS